MQISHEDLAEAGLDIEHINNLSHEQITILMEVAERRAQRELMTSQEVVVEEKFDVMQSPSFGLLPY